MTIALAICWVYRWTKLNREKLNYLHHFIPLILLKTVVHLSKMSLTNIHMKIPKTDVGYRKPPFCIYSTYLFYPLLMQEALVFQSSVCLSVSPLWFAITAKVFHQHYWGDFQIAFKNPKLAISYFTAILLLSPEPIKCKVQSNNTKNSLLKCNWGQN